MKTLIVNTIYQGFAGEVNIHGVGARCTFVRLAGCNLRCYKNTMGILCDTPEALEFCGNKMDIETIALEVERLGNPLVCLTGGEPLMQPVEDLLELLTKKDNYVVIETNGSKSISRYRHFRRVSFVVDCKSSSSGESERMIEDNYALMDDRDYLKFVINDAKDYWEMREWISNHPDFEGTVAVGLFWGSKMGYQELMKNLLDDRLHVEVNMQTHKMACMYDYFKDCDNFSNIVIPKKL